MLLKLQKQQSNTYEGTITVGLYMLFVIAKDIVDDVITEMQHELLAVYRNDRKLLSSYKYNTDVIEFEKEFFKRISRYNGSLVSALFDDGSRKNYILNIDTVNTTAVYMKSEIISLPVEIPHWLYSIPRRVSLPLVISDGENIGTLDKIIHG